MIYEPRITVEIRRRPHQTYQDRKVISYKVVRAIATVKPRVGEIHHQGGTQVITICSGCGQVRRNRRGPNRTLIVACGMLCRWKIRRVAIHYTAINQLIPHWKWGRGMNPRSIEARARITVAA